MALTKESVVDGMLQVTTAEVQRKFGYYADEAMLRPIRVQRYGTTRFVMLPIAEYERLASRDRIAVRVADLGDEQAEAIMNAKPADECPADDVDPGDDAA